MTSDDDLVQNGDWQALHDQITELLDKYGRKDPVGEGDYWLLDENWGWERQQLEFQNLTLLQPHIIKALQSLLANFSNWDITVRIAVRGKENEWPGMGLLISHNEIIDDLQRDFLPEPIRSFIYAGSRPPKR